MIKDKTEGYLDEVKASEPARLIKGHTSLDHMLNYLDTFTDPSKIGRTRCELFRGHPTQTPLSFFFRMYMRGNSEEEYKEWFTGSLVFQKSGGNESGRCMRRSPLDGWSLQTRQPFSS